MLSLAVIIFREVLEISLIIGVVLAATRGLAGRNRWVWFGLLGGVAGSCVVALSAGAISQAVAGMGQELFNALVLLLAALLIGWTVIWMRRHSCEMTQRLRAVGQAVAEGKRPLHVIAVVVALAMLREGSEIVLMTYGVMVSGGTAAQLLAGGLLGMVAGVGLGAAIYYGLVKMATRYVFSVTGFMLAFLAAGMVSQALELLGAAGFVPVLDMPLWDTSWLLSEHSLLGSILRTLAGYSAQPTGMQLVGFVLTLTVLTLLMRTYGGNARVAKVEVEK